MSHSRLEWAQPFVTAAVDAVRAADAAADAVEPWQLGLVDAACAIHDGALTPKERASVEASLVLLMKALREDQAAMCCLPAPAKKESSCC